MSGPHQGQKVLEAGEPLATARAAMILVHGRGASAEDIMTVGAELMFPGFAYLAPQAAGSAWYPLPFTSPLEANEPYLSSALETLATLLATVEKTIPASRVVLLGFSQGACLTLEFAARHARRYGAVVGLSGGLIGPDGTDLQRPAQSPPGALANGRRARAGDRRASRDDRARYDSGDDGTGCVRARTRGAGGDA